MANLTKSLEKSTFTGGARRRPTGSELSVSWRNLGTRLCSNRYLSPHRRPLLDQIFTPPVIMALLAGPPRSHENRGGSLPNRRWLKEWCHQSPYTSVTLRSLQAPRTVALEHEYQTL